MSNNVLKSLYIMQHAEYCTIPYATCHTSNTIYHTKENYMPDTTYYKLYTIDIYIYTHIYTYTLYRYTVESSLCKMLCTVHWLYSICNMPNATFFFLLRIRSQSGAGPRAGSLPNATRYMLHYTQITIPCTLYTIHYAICTPCTIHCILIYIHLILTVYYFVLCNLYWLLLYTCMTIHIYTYTYIYICTFIRTKYVLCTMHWVLCTMHWVLYYVLCSMHHITTIKIQKT